MDPPLLLPPPAPAKKAPRKAARITVSERLSGATVRYYKRGGKTMARCRHCNTLVRGGLRGMAKHGGTCKEWSKSARLMIDTPYEVKQEVVRLNRELGECKKKLGG